MKFPSVYRLLYKSESILYVENGLKANITVNEEDNSPFYQQIIKEVGNSKTAAIEINTLVGKIIARNNNNVSGERAWYSYRYYKYFNYLVYQKEITNYSFQKSFLSLFWENAIEDWVERDCTLDLEGKLYGFKTIATESELFKWLSGVFCLETKLSKGQNSENFYKLYNLLSFGEKSIVNSIYKGQSEMETAILVWLINSNKYYYEKMNFVLYTANVNSRLRSVTKSAKFLQSMAESEIQLVLNGLLEKVLYKEDMSLIVEYAGKIYINPKLLQMLMGFSDSELVAWKHSMYGIIMSWIESNDTNKLDFLFACIDVDFNSDGTENYAVNKKFIGYFLGLIGKDMSRLTENDFRQIIDSFNYTGLESYKAEFDAFVNAFFIQKENCIYYDKFSKLRAVNYINNIKVSHRQVLW
jgi:hypothetical protein